MSGNTSSSFSNLMNRCTNFQTGIAISISVTITKFLVVVPLSILVLTLGFRRWRRQRSFQTTSHADIFAYHAAAFELIYGLAVVFFFSGFFTGASWVLMMGICAASVIFPGQIFLHIMTCVERYLAVVYPIVYLGLRQSGGVRIRNISVGSVWLLSFGWIGVNIGFYPNIPYAAYFLILVLSLVIISFCSLSVLCVLIRRGPGEVGGVREQADQSKKKAFVTITAILLVLLLYFLATIVCLAVKTSNLLNDDDSCMLLQFAQFLDLPFSVVLLLLFLQRTKEIQCFCKK